MPTQLTQVLGFCSGRHDRSRARLPGLANAHMAIMNFAYDLRNSADPERSLLDFLRQQHEDPDLSSACNEVLKHLAGAPPRRHGLPHA